MSLEQEEKRQRCQLSSYVRSHNGILPMIHHWFSSLKIWVQTGRWDKDGTLLKVEEGHITVTGTEDDKYTKFWIYVQYVDNIGLTYRIQSAESGQYIGIEDDQLVVKAHRDLTDRFRVLHGNQGYIVFQSDGGRCIRAEADGTIFTETSCDLQDTHTWFRRIPLEN